jgi:uncharacterized protein YbaR (Trm112 family)
MLRDLLDSLRCPRPHDESWLVAVVHRADGPYLVHAALACPVCGAEFAVVDGAAHFDAPEVVAHDEALDAVRTAALLGLTEGDTLPVLLAGSYAGIGASLAALVPTAQVWLNPPVGTAAPAAPFSALFVRGRAPLGVDTIAAAAVDAAHATPPMLDSIVRTVRPGGRVIAPAHVDVPGSLRTLARDAREWVAEVTTRASGLVELRRRAPDQVA